MADSMADATHLHIIESRPTEVMLRAQPCGGFTVKSGPNDLGRSKPEPNAAFTTLDEALVWLRVNMAQPARDAA